MMQPCPFYLHVISLVARESTTICTYAARPTARVPGNTLPPSPPKRCCNCCLPCLHLISLVRVYPVDLALQYQRDDATAVYPALHLISSPCLLLLTSHLFGAPNQVRPYAQERPRLPGPGHQPEGRGDLVDATRTKEMALQAEWTG